SNANGLCGKFWPSQRELSQYLKYMAVPGFLISSPLSPASQSRFYVPRQFARAFGNDRFQGLEPYPSIAALVRFWLLSLARLQVCDDEIVDRSRSCVPRIGRLA